MSNSFRVDRIGYKGVNLKGHSFTLITYNNACSVVVKFDRTGTEVHTSFKAVYQGKVKDFMEPSVQGVGIVGDNKARGSDGKKIPSYASWECMLQRCYDKKVHERRPLYADVSVCDAWLIYDNFKIWYDTHYVDGFFLDKDLTEFGNRVYCPEFCSYVPHKINSLLEDVGAQRGDYPIGVSLDKRNGKFLSKVSRKPDEITLRSVHDSEQEGALWYKANKEAYVKRIAKEYFSSGLINQTIYSNLMSFTVECDI